MVYCLALRAALHFTWDGMGTTDQTERDQTDFLRLRLTRLKAWLRDEQKLKIAAPDFGDIEPLPEEWPGPFEKLVKLQEFN